METVMKFQVEWRGKVYVWPYYGIIRTVRADDQTAQCTR